MEMPLNERLVSVETKLVFIQDILKEIRDDLKDQPSKEEYLDLKSRVNELEKSIVGIKIKVYAFSAIISLLSSGIGVYIIQSLIGK